MIMFRKGEFLLEYHRLFTAGCGESLSIQDNHDLGQGTVLHSGTGLHWRLA